MDLKKKFLAGVCVSIFSFSCVLADPNIKPAVDRTSVNYSVAESNLESPEALELLSKKYKGITKDVKVMQSFELMKNTLGSYSLDAIMGNNLTKKKMKIEFKNLNEINAKYASFDALGWKKSGKLYIYINEKHQDAPSAALAALLSHEALHQDELDSLNEETYAWTLEAAVWTQLTEKDSSLENLSHPLVYRQNSLKKLFEKGEYTNKYLKKAVYSNPGYKNLPTRSPGFEDEDIEDL